MVGWWVGLGGVVGTRWGGRDMFKKNISTAGKVIASVRVLRTRWVGLGGYYFYGRGRLEAWFR